MRKKNQTLDDDLEKKRYRERMILEEKQQREQEARLRYEKIRERRAVEEQNQAMLEGYERSPSDPKHKPPTGKEEFAIGIAGE